MSVAIDKSSPLSAESLELGHEPQSAKATRSAYYSLVESLSAIRRLSDLDLRAIDERELLLQAARILIEYQGLDRCEVKVLESGRTRSLLRIGYDAGGRLSTLADRGMEPDRGYDAAAACAGCSVCMRGDVGEPTRQDREPVDNGSLVCVPLVAFERYWGFVHAFYDDPRRATVANRQTLSLFGRILSQMIESSRLLTDMGRAVSDKTREIEQTNAHLEREILDRVRIEGELRQAHGRFKDFAEIAADWFWESDAGMRVSFLSDRFEDATGMAPDTLLGRSPSDFPAEIVPIYWKQQLQQMRRRQPFKDLQVMLRRDSGQSRILCIGGKPIVDDQGRFVGYRGAGQDITKAHQMSQELAYHARHDALTGLLNRREFEDNLDRMLVAAKHGGSSHVLCYLDLDQFKVINDTCGHVAGDELLRNVAQLLQRKVRKTDVLARLGGDEFGLLMENCSAEHAARVATSLCHEVQEFRFSWAGSVFSVGVSIGVVPINERSRSVASSLSAADAACYVAKNEGRNRIHVNEENDTQLARWKQEMEWVSKITSALEEDRFQLCFQPIVPVFDDAARGNFFELLVRMRARDGSLILPGAFLPAAERYSLSTRIDRWVTQNTLRWLAGHRDQLDELGWCSINLSGHSLSDDRFLELLDREFTESGVPADKICFEITETAVISNLSNSIRFIEKFKERGCRFSLDDFGSGLSSFAYLKTLPVDYVKIDGLFVRDIASDPIDYAMVRSINEISQLMGKKTIAEYVENRRSLVMLADLGVDYAQGNGIARPQPLAAEAIAEFSRDWRRR